MFEDGRLLAIHQVSAGYLRLTVPPAVDLHQTVRRSNVSGSDLHVARIGNARGLNGTMHLQSPPHTPVFGSAHGAAASIILVGLGLGNGNASSQLLVRHDGTARLGRRFRVTADGSSLGRAG
jgi:hypothetical protein